MAAGGEAAVDRMSPVADAVGAICRRTEDGQKPPSRGDGLPEAPQIPDAAVYPEHLQLWN